MVAAEGDAREGDEKTPDVPHVRPRVEGRHVAEVRCQCNAARGVPGGKRVLVHLRYAEGDFPDIQVRAWPFEDEFYGSYDDDVNYQDKEHVATVMEVGVVGGGGDKMEEEKQKAYGKPRNTVPGYLQQLAAESNEFLGQGDRVREIEGNGCGDLLVQEEEVAQQSILRNERRKEREKEKNKYGEKKKYIYIYIALIEIR